MTLTLTITEIALQLSHLYLYTSTKLNLHSFYLKPQKFLTLISQTKLQVIHTEFRLISSPSIY